MAGGTPEAAFGADWIEEVVALDGLDVVIRRPSDAEALLDDAAYERDGDVALPYWAELWPSGVALARALRGRALGGRRVVELGCGLGLASIVAALEGATAIATDWSPRALGAAAANAAANGVTLRTACVDVADAAALDALAPVDLVVVGDLLYERPLVPRVLAALERLGAPALVADPGRATAAPFVEQASAAFVVQRRPDPVTPHVHVCALQPR